MRKTILLILLLVVIVSGCNDIPEKDIIDEKEEINVKSTEKPEVNEKLIFEKVKNFNYENNIPISSEWMDAEIAELKGPDIEAKFLFLRGAGDWNMHYCPIYLKINQSVVDSETYNLCHIDYTGDETSKVSEDKVLEALLKKLGFRLTYGDSGWRPIQAQKDVYNSKRDEIINSSVFITKPIRVIDVKYETGQSGLGCYVYEAHLFLDENLDVITGDDTYEICVD